MDYKYLEISGRQTGKTDRMVQRLQDDFYRDHHRCHSIIILPNRSIEAEFLDKLRKKDKHLYNIATNPPKDNQPPPKTLGRIELPMPDLEHAFIGRSDFRIYLGDFDLLDWGRRELKYFKSVLKFDAKSIYAYTTPTFFRSVEDLKNKESDILLTLLDFCGNQVTHINEDLADTGSKREQRPDGVRLREVFGTFTR